MDKTSEDLAEEFAKSIFTGLKDGIEAIKSITVTILDTASEKRDICNQIRRDVEKAKACFEQSDKAATELLKVVDELYERLVNDTRRLEEEEKQNKEALSRLKEEHDTNIRLQAILGLWLTASGIFSSILVGWIPGLSVMVGSAQMKRYEGMIAANQKDIAATKESLEDIWKRINELHEQRNAIADFQRMLREAVDLLDRIAGQVKVAEHLTRETVELETVIVILGSVIAVIKEIPGVEALHDKGVNRLIETVSKNYRRIKAPT
ncbi:uncharacterized protein LOC144542767 [Centroberyx gerrardi]